MSLLSRRTWVFDLDGTLTVAAHDFDGLRRRLGLPAGEGILEAIGRRPDGERQRLLAEVAAWEAEIAAAAVAEADAVDLLAALAARGVGMAVVTRNRKDLAWVTLRAAGLQAYFSEPLVIGRDCAPPKPAPDGVLLAITRLGGTPSDAVMVGDWRWDVEAGHAAGALPVLIDRRDEVTGVQAPHRRVRDLRELLHD